MYQAMSVTYAPAGSRALDFQRVATTTMTFEEVLPRLRAGIEEAGLWLLHEVNPQELLMRGGFNIRPARQLLFFHPRFMARILHHDPSALLEAPLKVAVIEGPTGRTMIRWFDPAAAFGRYANNDLTELGEELAEMCRFVVQHAVPDATL
jgi:uncharacterized protein (DUF302 family)